MKRKSVTWGLLLLTIVLGAVACRQPARTVLELAPASALPPAVQQLSPEVQEAYRFALAHPGILSQIPCYCGCGGLGHGSNLDCYIKAFAPDGSVIFEDHAFA